MPLANKLRVYHLPKKKSAVRRALCVLLLLKKNILSFKKGTRSILLTLTHLLLHQNFQKKWAKQLTPIKRLALFTPPKFGQHSRLQPCVLFTNKYDATLRDPDLAQRYLSSVYNWKENSNVKAKLYSKDIQILHLLWNFFKPVIGYNSVF